MSAFSRIRRFYSSISSKLKHLATIMGLSFNNEEGGGLQMKGAVLKLGRGGALRGKRGAGYRVKGAGLGKKKKCRCK